MVKSLRLLAFFAACILTAGTLGGCSSDESVKSYMQALLDASYKNDATAFVEMGLGTADEAQALYEQGIDSGVSVLCEKIGASKEFENDLRDTYKNLLSKVRYNVEEAKKQKDGSYIVTLSYEKMKIFKPAQEMHQKNAEAMIEEWTKSTDEILSEEEMTNQIMMEFKKSLDAVLEDVEYDAPASINIRVELKDKVYMPNVDDITELEMALFDGT